MSKLRPECRTSTKTAMANVKVYYLLRMSLRKRRSLIHGRLDDDRGRHCAMGAFWADHPHVAVYSSIVDEVAAVNDSVPKATPFKRWCVVNEWLKLKLKNLGGK